MVLVRAPDGSLCTGTLIAPTVVLTAAHCLAPSIRAGLQGGDVGFGADVEDLTATRDIRSLFVHRQFTGSFADGFDIGLIRLAEPAPTEVEPVPWSAAQLDPSVVGFVVRAVGFGVLSPVTGAGQGVKRTVELVITQFSGEYLRMGDPYSNTCQGDSGGPIFRIMGGIEQVIAVGSYGEFGCRGPSTKTRLDVYSELIDEVVAAWSGPCAEDGVCGTAECAFADPDCDECGLNGVCAQGCARVDLDCPVGGLIGDPCERAIDCESRLCDPQQGVCARPCLATRVHACEDGYECVEGGPGAAPEQALAEGGAATLCRSTSGCAIAAPGRVEPRSGPAWTAVALLGLLVLPLAATARRKRALRSGQPVRASV